MSKKYTVAQLASKIGRADIILANLPVPQHRSDCQLLKPPPRNCNCGADKICKEIEKARKELSL